MALAWHFQNTFVTKHHGVSWCHRAAPRWSAKFYNTSNARIALQGKAHVIFWSSGTGASGSTKVLRCSHLSLCITEVLRFCLVFSLEFLGQGSNLNSCLLVTNNPLGFKNIFSSFKKMRMHHNYQLPLCPSPRTWPSRTLLETGQSHGGSEDSDVGPT